MIYFVHGDDLLKRQKAFNLIDKELGIVVKNYIKEGDMNMIDEAIESQSIFGDNLAYYITGFLSNKDTREYIYDRIERMMKSDNFFVIDETNILKVIATKVGKYSTKEYDCELIKDEESKVFVPKELCDAILNRDRRKAFIEFHKLLQSEESGEAIAAILWWRVRTMIEALLSGKQYISEFDGKDSSGRTAWKRVLINYKLEELESLGYSFVILPALAHTDSSVDINLELEKVLLSI